IQEHRFNQYCERLQNTIIEELDKEFKMFMNWRGYNIDSSTFTLSFTPPQNFASYRETELDQARLANYSSVAEIPYLSERFKLTRYLGLSEEEMEENERMRREELGLEEETAAKGSDLRGVGVGGGDFDADMGAMDDMDFDGDMEGDMDMDADMGGEPAGDTEI
ncbi:MAG: hypothetical protein DRQ47_05440, partial [Gammaproteobacteria bacterium]